MRRLLKLLLIPLVLVVVLVGASLILLNTMVAASIERGGTYALGVETTVEEVDVGLGKRIDARLEGLRVANPEGYRGDHFAALASGSLDFPLAGLTGGELVVPEILLDGLELHVERRGGENNYDVILDHLERLGGDGEPGAEEPPAGDPGDRVFRIERIVLTDVTATVDLLPVGGDATQVGVTIPEIVIEDVRDGMTTAEIFEIVLRTVLRAVLQNGGDLLPQDMLNDLRGRLDALGAVRFELAEGAVRTTETLLQEGTQALEQGAEQLEQEAEKALKEGLGGLLEKGKQGDG